MSRLPIAIAAVFAGTMAMPALATTTSSEKEGGDGKVVAMERIEVTAVADPSFTAEDGANVSHEFTQHAYGRVDGRWMHVDKLTHPDYPFARVAAADMEQQYPGA